VQQPPTSVNQWIDQRSWLKSREGASLIFTEVSDIFAQINENLLQRLDFLGFTPSRILQIGAWDGRFALQLSERYPQAQLSVLEMASGFVALARQNIEKSNKNNLINVFEWASGPFPAMDGSADLVICPLSLPPYMHWEGFLAEVRRVLQPRGYLSISTLGARSLEELRSVADQAAEPSHLHDFIDIQSLGMALVTAGLTDPVVDGERVQFTYRSMAALRRDLKCFGMSNNRQDRRRCLHKSENLANLSKSGSAFLVPNLSVEVLYAQGFAPTGAPPKKVMRTEQVLPFPTRSKPSPG